MKKNHITAILILIIFCGCASKFSNEEVCKKVKNLLIGTWEMKTAPNFIMKIGEHNITYYYNDSLTFQNRYVLLCKDSILEYAAEEEYEFNFMSDGKLNIMAEIKEFREVLNDTSVVPIVYLDKDNIELAAMTGSVHFHRIK